MNECQLIDSAPKDGTQILAYACGGLGQHFYGVAEWAKAKDYLPGSVDGWFWPYAIRPTHWWDLPSPPLDVQE